MATPIAYRLPRRFITPPEEPPPYGLFALSLIGHLGFFFAVVVLSVVLGTRLDESKIYVVNLVPAAPNPGAPTPGPVSARPERTPPPAEPVRPEPRTPPAPEAPPVKAETRTPPAPEAPAVKAEVRTPPKAETPPPPRELAPPRSDRAPEPLAPPKLPEIARAAPVRPTELALPRRVEKESPALDVPGSRDKLVERLLPPPPSVGPRLPEPPRVTTPQAPPSPPPAVTTPARGSPGLASPRPPVEPVRLGSPNVGVGSTGSISLDVSDFPFTYYLRQIQAKISERWAPPRAAARGGERATILFEIGRDGSIKEPSLERSSGVTLYDQSALRAVAEASPFPPLPPEFKAPSLRVHFGFEFHPDQG